MLKYCQTHTSLVFVFYLKGVHAHPWVSDPLAFRLSKHVAYCECKWKLKLKHHCFYPCIDAFPLRTVMCCLDKCFDGVFHSAWWQHVAGREYVCWYLRTWSLCWMKGLASTLMYAHTDQPFIQTTKSVEWPYDKIPAIWRPLPLFIQCHLSV